MKILLDLNVEQIANELSAANIPKYKAAQIHRWLIKGKTFDEMTDIDKNTRQHLRENYIDQPVKIVKEVVSEDKTRKFLFSLYDGNIIESVLMCYGYGNTVCVSTQVGCRMGCVFCASTLGGLVRNLTAGEILGQVVAINGLAGGTADKRAVSNIVLMGSGEPFDNYANTVNFLRLVNDGRGLNISLRNISLSTCGLVNEMKKFADENLPVNLTVSLHSPNDKSRSEIMPINKKYRIADVVVAAKEYFNKTGRRVIFEYVLIVGKNDTQKDAEKLAELLRGMSAHVNLIRLNPVKERNLKGSSVTDAKKFMEMLKAKGVSVTIRRQTGADIDGACGQLRAKYVENCRHD